MKIVNKYDEDLLPEKGGHIGEHYTQGRKSTWAPGCGSPWPGHGLGRKEYGWCSAYSALSLRKGLWGVLGRGWEGETESN